MAQYTPGRPGHAGYTLSAPTRPVDGPGRGQGPGVVDPGSDALAGRLEALPVVPVGGELFATVHQGGLVQWGEALAYVGRTRVARYDGTWPGRGR
jgi:hypothetical protein